MKPDALAVLARAFHVSGEAPLSQFADAVEQGEPPKLVRAIVPLSNMFGYTGDLRSMSQGRATFTMQFDHYEQVPNNVAQAMRQCEKNRNELAKEHIDFKNLTPCLKGVLLAAGGFTPSSAEATVSAGEVDLVAFGRDFIANPDWREGQSPARRLARLYSLDQEETHDAIAAMRALTDTYEDRVLIGEIYLPLHRLVAYYGNDLTGAHLPFNFALLSTLWSARSIEKIIADYEAALPAGAWPNWVLGNHDRSRVASRLRAEQARIAAQNMVAHARGKPLLARDNGMINHGSLHRWVHDQLGTDRSVASRHDREVVNKNHALFNLVCHRIKG